MRKRKRSPDEFVEDLRPLKRFKVQNVTESEDEESDEDEDDDSSSSSDEEDENEISLCDIVERIIRSEEGREWSSAEVNDVIEELVRKGEFAFEESQAKFLKFSIGGRMSQFFLKNEFSKSVHRINSSSKRAGGGFRYVYRSRKRKENNEEESNAIVPPPPVHTHQFSYRTVNTRKIVEKISCKNAILEVLGETDKPMPPFNIYEEIRKSVKLRKYGLLDHEAFSVDEVVKLLRGMYQSGDVQRQESGDRYDESAKYEYFVWSNPRTASIQYEGSINDEDEDEEEEEEVEDLISTSGSEQLPKDDELLEEDSGGGTKCKDDIFMIPPPPTTPNSQRNHDNGEGSVHNPSFQRNRSNYITKSESYVNEENREGYREYSQKYIFPQKKTLNLESCDPFLPVPRYHVIKNIFSLRPSSSSNDNNNKTEMVEIVENQSIFKGNKSRMILKTVFLDAHGERYRSDYSQVRLLYQIRLEGILCLRRIHMTNNNNKLLLFYDYFGMNGLKFFGGVEKPQQRRQIRRKMLTLLINRCCGLIGAMQNMGILIYLSLEDLFLQFSPALDHVDARVSLWNGNFKFVSQSTAKPERNRKSNDDDIVTNEEEKVVGEWIEHTKRFFNQLLAKYGDSENEKVDVIPKDEKFESLATLVGKILFILVFK